MFQLSVSGKIIQYRKLNVPSNERYQSVALLKEYARHAGVPYDRFWVLWVPKHADAFVQLNYDKKFTVLVQCDELNVNQGDWQKQFPDAQFCVGVEKVFSL